MAKDQSNVGDKASQEAAAAQADAEKKRLADEAAERQLQAEIEAEEAEKKRAAEAQAKADAAKHADAESERMSLESRLARLEEESAERDAEVVRLRQKLAEKTGSKEPILMRATAFNAEKSAKQIRDIWPRDSERLAEIYRSPMPLGKTFLVTPTGTVGADMNPAIISNCADESDAKREYFAKTGAVPHKVSVRVEPYGDTRRILEEQNRQFESQLLQTA
jgi:hypothetical protein